MQDRADVVVVGAGPGGSSTAYHLAERGWSVRLVDRRAFARDKSCGDALSPLAVRELQHIGVGDLLEGMPAAGVRIVRDQRVMREFRFGEAESIAPGLVVPRLRLDAIVRDAALRAGAVGTTASVIDLARTADQSAPLTVVATDGHDDARLGAKVVVGADGATSIIGRKSGLQRPEGWHRGIALRAYFDHVEDLDDMLEFYVPIEPADQSGALPAYGWIFRSGESTANIGLGVALWHHRTRLWPLWEQFLDRLKTTDGRLRSIEPRARPVAAPLRFDFDASRVVAPGVVLVGEAAGLVSPFTGEGIGMALKSGREAATAIDAFLRGHADDLHPYAEALNGEYGSYFEMSRYSVKRYQLCWNLLDSSVRSDRPLQRHWRQAVLFHEAFGTPPLSPGQQFATPSPKLRIQLFDDLGAVGKLVVGCIRKEWPAIAGYIADIIMSDETRFRPALVVLLSSYADEGPRDADHRLLAASIELGHLAALCHLSVQDAGRATEPSRHWGNSLAVLVGDYLLCEALRIVGTVSAPGVAASLVLELATLSGRLATILQDRRMNLPTPALYESQVLGSWGRLHAFGPTMAARLVGRSPTVVDAIDRYSRHAGTAWHLSDEIVAAVDGVVSASSTAGVDTGDPLLGLPASWLAAGTPTAHAAVRRWWSEGEGSSPEARDAFRDLILEANSIAPSVAACRRHVDIAIGALDGLPPGAVRDTFGQIALEATSRIERALDGSTTLLHDSVLG